MGGGPAAVAGQERRVAASAAWAVLGSPWQKSLGS